MPKGVILTIDQGTTGTRSLVVDRGGHIAGKAYEELRQYYPKPSWVEHGASEIWASTERTMAAALADAGDGAALAPLADHHPNEVVRIVGKQRTEFLEPAPPGTLQSTRARGGGGASRRHGHPRGIRRIARKEQDSGGARVYEQSRYAKTDQARDFHAHIGA